MTSPRVRAGVRTDIQALRALAVLAVVAYHVRPAALPGGFVGVDLFFVVSGFLIGGGLIHELASSARISFSAFYARRARRILPMAMLVTVTTLVASLAVASPVRLLIWGQPWGASSYVKDGIAATLYAPNIWFAAQQREYLADDTVSPFLHYWSLGIEEQFYFVVPVLLALAWLATRRSLRGLACVAGVTTVASFAYGVWLSRTDAPLAFFNPASRAWELGVGLLAALAIESGLRPGTGRGTALLRGTTLAVVVAVVAFAPFSEPWPGGGAAIPVVACALLVWAGSGAVWAGSGARQTASREWWGWRPIQAVGDWSYSLYLWHWPLLVLAAVAVGRHLRWFEMLALVVVAFALSALSYRFVEQPFRRASVRTGAERRRILLASVAGVLATLGVALGIATVAARTSEATAPWVDPYTLPSPAASLPTPSASANPSIPEPVFAEILPGNVRPALADARGELSRVSVDGCHRSTGQLDIPSWCLYGDGDGPVVAVFGDSHAAMWIEPLLEMSDEGQISVLALTASSCPAFDLPFDLDAPRVRGDCAAWREAAFEVLEQTQPDVVLLAAFTGYPLEPGSNREEAYAAGLAEVLARIPASTRVVVVSDTPLFPDDPVACAGTHGDDLAVCGGQRADVIDAEVTASMVSETRAADATYVDLTPYFCSAAYCGIVQGDVLMYRDAHHLTVTFARELLPVLVASMGLVPPS